MDVVGHQAITEYAEVEAFSVLTEPFEVCTSVAVVAVFAEMLQLPVEQPDDPAAHGLILWDGVGFGRWVPGARLVSHAVQRGTRPRPGIIRELLGVMWTPGGPGQYWR